MKKKVQKGSTMTETLSTQSEWEKINEDKQWSDFVQWCKEQEHCTHE